MVPARTWELMDWEDMTDFRKAPEHPQLRSRTRGSEFRGKKEIIAKVREGFLEELKFPVEL